MSEKEPAQSIEQRPDQQISENQPVQQEARLQRQIQQHQYQSEVNQIRMNQIVNGLNVQKERQPKVQEIVLTHVQPPEIKNPLYVYKGHEKYDWNIGQLDTACIEKLQNKFAPDLYEFFFLNEVNITVTTVNNLKGHLHYTLKIDDRNGEREVSRRYTQLILLRSKLVELWPGIMFCIFPNKSKIGVSQGDLIRSRSQYITRFFRHLSRHQGIYYSEEVQTFIKNSDNINLQVYIQTLPVLKPMQIFEKYKKQFPEEYQQSLKQDFLYRKEELTVGLEEYEVFFSKKKMDLSDYMGSIIRMAESKQKYFRAASRLNTELLADYQDTISRWIKNQPLPQSPPSIMQRLSFSQPRKNSISNIQNLKDVKGSQEKKSVKEQVQLGQKRLSRQVQKVKEQTRLGLLSSQAYKSRLEDTALLIHDYNSSSWKIYEVIKYQLKEIDSVLGAIEQTKAIFREVVYLKRTIGINKEQIEALNNNKTTMKTFFMEGNNQEKKTKLTSDNQSLEQQLQKMEQFYYLLMALLQKQLKQYHLQRSNFYNKSIKKAFTDQIGILRSLMDFHIYEEQLFAKELNQRLIAIRQQSNPEADQPQNQQ